MASKTIKHDKHEHIIKTVNEEYMGLLMDDRDTKRISESFGWSDKMFSDCLDKMIAFQDFQDAVDNLEDDLPKSTKTSTFMDFLKSNTFKKLGIKIATPNDYVMLGFIFSATIIKKGLSDDMREMMGMGNPEKITELIAKLRRVIEERM